MNASAEHNHLFSPLEGEDTDHSSHISFMGAPFVPVDSDDLSSNKAPYVFIGAPFDEGNVGKPGCEDGAREFRVASLGIPSYWFEFNVDLKGEVVDAGDVSMPRVNPDVARERIYNAVRKVLAQVKFQLFVVLIVRSLFQLPKRCQIIWVSAKKWATCT